MSFTRSAEPTSPPSTSSPATPSPEPCRASARPRRRAAVRDRRGPGQLRPRCSTACSRCRTSGGGSPATGRRLEVMLGYSDSAKELGPAAATLALVRRAGRGWPPGPPARRPADPVPRPRRRARPRRRPGQPRRARPGAGLGRRPVQGHRAGRGHLRPIRPPPPSPAATWSRWPPRSCSPRRRRSESRTAEAAEALPPTGRPARHGGSEQAYHDLVPRPTASPTGSPGDSPLEEIGCLRLGSRPARRGASASASLDDLRAIPWVFAWAQTRVNLPGWYGLGTGLAAVARPRPAAAPAYAVWPLFTALLDNAEMSPGQDRPPDRGPLPGAGRPPRPRREGARRVRPHA